MPSEFVSLMYHNVVSNDPAAARAESSGLSRSITSYWVTATDFARHLDTISSTTDILTYADLQQFFSVNPEFVERLRQRPLVQLTFDDGWRGSVDIAGPLLAERSLQ